MIGSKNWVFEIIWGGNLVGNLGFFKTNGDGKENYVGTSNFMKNQSE
jgi:hypothetical protein